VPSFSSERAGVDAMALYHYVHSREDLAGDQTILSGL